MGFPAYRAGMLQFGRDILRKVQRIKLTSYLIVTYCEKYSVSNLRHISSWHTAKSTAYQTYIISHRDILRKVQRIKLTSYLM